MEGARAPRRARRLVRASRVRCCLGEGVANNKRVALLVPAGKESGYGEGVAWGAVGNQLAKRCSWGCPIVHVDVVEVEKDGLSKGEVRRAIEGADCLIASCIEEEEARMIEELLWTDGGHDAPPAIISFNCSDTLSRYTRLGNYSRSFLPSALAVVAPWTDAAKSKKALATARELWSRNNSDDSMYAILLLVDDAVVEVPLISQTVRNPGIGSLQCMLTNCKEEVTNCINDESCRTALLELSECPVNDQVCQYKAITTHESELFEKFSLCVLQKHNCLGNTACIPELPNPQVMSEWRGAALTHEAAEEILIGWLEKGEDFSWRAICGRNPAYDAFPCQYQIFYRGRGKTMWYDPVFKVILDDGSSVWRRRHYRVRRESFPGGFKFTVLDNGVLSDERWKIIDCADDLAWAVFYYAGAAVAAGQSYSGAIICSRTGVEDVNHRDRIEAACAKCGIEMWELVRVNNQECVSPPLGGRDDAE